MAMMDSLSISILAIEVRHLTPKFSYDDRNEMLYGLQATSVHNWPYHSVAFFPDQYRCHQAIRLLHQRRVHGRRLRVEFARPGQIRRLPVHLPCDSSLRRKIVDGQKKAFAEWKQQQKPEYRFPKVNRSIVDRIDHYLFENESFYHQVLLLMIQHGLEPPFEEQKKNSIDLDSIPLPSDSESELETHISPSDLNQSIAPEFELKRRKRKRKRLKTGLIGPEREPKICRTQPLTTVIQEVFDEPIKKINTKLSIHLSTSNLSEVNEPTRETTSDGFGTLPPVLEEKATPPPPRERFDVRLLAKTDLISDIELNQNRLDRSKWPEHSAFKNYNSGQPSQRLYIKNIHRKVTVRDLSCLYAKFIDLTDDSQLERFDVILMERGRMRGQAFVTFPETAQAIAALTATNGFVMQDKPLVVQYGRRSS